jgi:hypothetical protein
MGGQAFASLTPPLYTPRMPLSVYELVLKSTHLVLQKHYTHVASPIEAPGKTSYGDVDILVFGPLDASYDVLTPSVQVAEFLAEALGAKKWIREKGNPAVNLAVPWPSSSELSQDAEKEEEGYRERLVQVDIHTCPTLKIFNWELFHAAHGDLWNILGTTIRKFGLTVNDRGLYLRIAEIELLDRKKSMVFLTDEPMQVLGFLGLEEERWWRPFEERKEMFEYAAGCRMFWVKDKVDEEKDEGDVGMIEGQEGGEKGKKQLKHNDRQRMSKRPIFKEWIEDFIPKCREDGRYGEAKVTREQIRDEAFGRFGVKEEYDDRLKSWKLVRHQEEIWRDAIKGCVPVENVDPQFRAAAIRTLKGVIMEDDLFDGVKPQAAVKNEDGFYDVEAVNGFVAENWKKAGDIGWGRQQANARDGMRLKAEKRDREEREGKVQVAAG